MKHDPTMICTCTMNMTTPNYMGGNCGENTIWWCPNCDRIKFKDWSGKYRSIKPKQQTPHLIEALRRLLNWAEGMYILAGNIKGRENINWSALEDARKALLVGRQSQSLPTESEW